MWTLVALVSLCSQGSMSKKHIPPKHKSRLNYILCLSWPDSYNNALPLCSWFSFSLLLLHQQWHISNAELGPFISLNRNLTWPKKANHKNELLSIRIAVQIPFGKDPARKRASKKFRMSILLTCEKESIFMSKTVEYSTPSFCAILYLHPDFILLCV